MPEQNAALSARAELCDSLFQGYVVSNGVFALAEMGYFDLIRKSGSLDCTRAASDLQTSEEFLLPLCRALASAGILCHSAAEEYSLTPDGDRLCDRLGYFTWAIGGYGDVFANLPQICVGRKVFARDVRRDEALVARGAGAVGKKFVLPMLEDLVQGIGISRIADLGCGSARMIIELCLKFPHISAVGIDISADACLVARENIKECGLESRIQIVHANVAELFAVNHSSRHATLEGVDAVSCFFMLHDLMRDVQGRVTLLSRMREFFAPGAKFLFADTMKWEAGSAERQPGFSGAFEIVHAAMRQPTWTRSVYDELFAAARFEVCKLIPLDIPASWLYVLRAA